MLAWRRAPASEPADRCTYLLRRCQDCGTAVTVGGSAGVAAHASGAYRPGAPRGSAMAAPLLGRFDARRLALLAPSSDAPARETSRRLLDVGAGRGRFVAFARERGWDAQGIDPSPRWRSPLVHPIALESFEVEQPFDAVSAWHVLEHLDDPGAALARLRDWLRPGGTLLVGVPNLDSWQARLGGPVWYHLDLPRHRTHFTARGVETALRRAGLAVIHTEHVLLEHNPFGLWQSLVNRMTPTPSWLFNALKRNAPLASPVDAAVTLAALPLAPVAVLAERLAGLAGRGGTVAVVARRV